MLLDAEIAGCSRKCATTGRAFAPGEVYFSTLHLENGSPVRRDFSAAAWQAAPDGALAWWRSRMPDADAVKPQLAPHDVLLNLFAALADEPAEAEFRYLLGLLLLRRRLVKLEDARTGADGEVLTLDCPRREEQFELRVAQPEAERRDALERRLGELLFGGE